MRPYNDTVVKPLQRICDEKQIENDAPPDGYDNSVDSINDVMNDMSIE